MSDTNKKNSTPKKGFWAGLIDALDKKLTGLSCSGGCCGSGDDKKKGGKCC